MNVTFTLKQFCYLDKYVFILLVEILAMAFGIIPIATFAKPQIIYSNVLFCLKIIPNQKTLSS